MGMNPPLRVLHLEDDVRDTELVQATLQAEEIQSTLTRVETELEFVAVLEGGSFDLILADYTLPSFDGLSALRIAQQRTPDIPFIFVSGTLGEDVAIEALKRGATDYVLKTRLVRLGPSITRALREAREKAERKRAEEALRQSEEQLRDLIETVPTMAFVSRPDGTNEFVSRQWIEFSGLSPEQTKGSGWEATLHPDDAGQHLTKWRGSHASGEPFENEARHRDAHGNYRWLLVRAVPLHDEQGQVVKWYGAVTDIEDRKRAEALLAEEKRILEMVAKGDSLAQILDNLCRLVERQATGVLASILLVNGNHLRHGGAPSLPKAYTDAIDGAAVGPCDGSCGTAAYTGKQVIVEDIATDPLWADYRDAALPHSLRACWSTPIFSSQGKVIATFAMYYREPRSPSPRDQQIIEQITHLAGIAIERKLTQDELALSERNLAEAQRLTHTGSFVWDIKTREALHLSDEWYRIYGFEPGHERAWDERLTRLAPEDRIKWQAAVDRAIKEKSDYELEKQVVLPDGRTKSLHALGHPVLHSSGEVVQFMGTVTDITERKRAEEALRRSEAYLAEAQKLSQTGSWAWSYRSATASYWSEENFRIWGLDPQQGLPEQGTVEKRIHPDDRERTVEATRKAMREKSDHVAHFRIVLPDGTVKHLESIGHPVFDATGEMLELVGTHVDVTERKRAEALLSGEKRLLEMIATGIPLKQILNALCLIIEEQRSDMLASVLLMKADGVHLNVIAAPNLPNEWIRQMEKLPIGPCAGSCGTAAFRGSPVIVSDIATDSLWDVPQHRAAALKHGLRASWSNPVVSPNGTVLGTFCIYHREARSPNTQDLELIDLATHIARVAIERDRAEEALRTSEQLARSHVEVMMRSLDVLATEAAPEKFIAEMLRTIGQRLHARSVLLWVRSQQDDSLHLQLVIENDQQIAPHPDHPFVKNPEGWKGSSYFQEMFFTKGPFVCDDIEHDPRIGADFREYLMKRGRRKFMAVPMFVLGEVRGFIDIQHVEGGTYRPEEIELAQALAHHVMMAAHGAEIAEQRRHAVLLEERTRMARDIHDTLAQGFTGVIVQLDTSIEALRDEEPEAAAKHIRRARELARESLIEARRSVHALRPQALERAGFADALKAIITNTAAGTSLHSDFQIKGEPRELQPAVEENLLHIGQEALTNALKHAGATEFQARLSFDSDAVRLELRDNGKGFVIDSTNGGGIGLIGMKERAQQIGATLAVTSKPGRGTNIIAVSPYQQPVMT
jgi:PAS domain S-box-containing protein